MREHRVLRARYAAWLLGLVTAFAAATGTTASTALGMSCGQVVIGDWLDDGVVDHAYAAACYSSALRALPQDLRLYSSAGWDITAARGRSATSGRSRSLESAQPAVAAPTDSSAYPPAQVEAIAAGAVLIGAGAAASIAWRRRSKRMQEP